MEKNLEEVETTSSPTGYPSDIIKATIGFSSFEEASEYAGKHGGYPCHLDRKAGWKYWHRGNCAYGPMELSEADFNDSITIIRKGYYDSQQECIEDWFFPYIEGEGTNIDTILIMADNLNTIWNEYLTLAPGQAILVDDGLFREKIELSRMAWTDDGKEYVIGVVND